MSDDEFTPLDAAGVLDALDRGAFRLDRLERGLSAATDALDQAEQNWLEVYDATALALKEEMDEQGRKGDPAEHTILRCARQGNRLAWGNYRKAKHLVDRLEKQIRAREKVINARQTQLNALRAEASGPVSSATGQAYGARRAA